MRQNQKAKVFYSYNLMFLPTLVENFGHAIVESLYFETSVLISDLTPWKNLEAFGVGWSIPLSEECRFISAIEQMPKMDRRERMNLTRAAFK